MATTRTLGLLPIAACLAAAGCTSVMQKAEHESDAGLARAQELRQAAGAVDPSTSAVVRHEDGLWIADRALKTDAAGTLPSKFSQRATFDRQVGSLAEFAERLALHSGLAVSITPDAAAASMRAFQVADGRLGGGTPAAAASTMPPAVLAPPVRSTAAGTATSTQPIRFTYRDGTLKGLLDAAATRFGVYWRPAEGGVQLYYTDTRAFQIRAIPGDASLSASVGNTAANDPSSGAGSGNVSGSTRNSQSATAVNSKLSVFDSIEKSVSTMLSAAGKVVASPATGTLSVTDTPDVLQRVARFVEDENKALSRQVMINVTVLAVSSNDLDDYGINWNLVYNDLSRQYGINTTYSAQPGAGAFSAAILNTAGSRFAGSSLMVSALSTQGKVRRETSASVATLNNQPVPVQVARQTAYLKSSSTTLTANVGSSTTLEPGTVTSGFNMSILPHVLSNGTVMLQFGTDISALRSIRTVSSGSSASTTSIETPEVDTRNFLQRVAMKSGDTLVISGFEQTDANLNRKGVGNASFFGLGGGLQATRDKEVIVILVTPLAMGGA